MNRTIGVVAAQVAPVPYDREATWRSFERHVRTLVAVFPNLELYVFPEVYLTALGSWDDGYPSGYVESVAEPIGGTLTERISELSRSVGKWIVPGSIYERPGVTSTTPPWSSTRRVSWSPSTERSCPGCRTRPPGPVPS